MPLPWEHRGLMLVINGGEILPGKLHQVCKFRFRALSLDRQPSVLRSPPMAALGGDYLSSLPVPEYPPSYPLPSELQGNGKTPESRVRNTGIAGVKHPESRV